MLLYAFIAGMIVGAFLWSRVSGWWRRSTNKKATDVVGSAAKGPTYVAKGLLGKLKKLWSPTPNDKKKE